MKLLIFALAAICSAQTVSPPSGGGGGSSPTTLTTCGPFTMDAAGNSSTVPLSCLSAPGAGKMIVVDSLNVQCSGCTAPTAFYDAAMDGTSTILTIAPASHQFDNLLNNTNAVPGACQVKNVLSATPSLCLLPQAVPVQNPQSDFVNQAFVITTQGNSFLNNVPLGKVTSVSVGSTPGTGYGTGEVVYLNGAECNGWASITQSGGIPSALSVVTPPTGYANVLLGGCPQSPAAAAINSSTTSQPSALTLSAAGTNYHANDTGDINGCTSPGIYKVLTVSGTAVATFQVLLQPTGCNGIGTLTTATDGPQPGTGSGFTLTETNSTDSGTLTATINSVVPWSGGSGNIYADVLWHTVTVH